MLKCVEVETVNGNAAALIPLTHRPLPSLRAEALCLNNHGAPSASDALELGKTPACVTGEGRLHSTANQLCLRKKY